MLRTHQEASAYDFSIIEARQAQSLTGDCQGIDAPAAHACNARRLWRELGARRFVGLQVLIGGLVLSALVHPWFYALLALNLWHGQLSSLPESVLGRSLLLIGVFNLIAGYISAIWLGAAACARRGRRRLSVHAVIMPLYWLAISLAAYRAIWQLASAPAKGV